MHVVEQLLQDLRYAARTLLRSPGFTFIAVLTLALGLSAAVTVINFADAVFRRPLPVAGGDRLVRVHFVDRRGGYDGLLGYGGSRYLRSHARSFDMVVAHYSTAPFYVSIGDAAQEIQGAVVSGNYFRMLGLEPRLGRFFAAVEDSAPDRDPVAVIGYDLWQARFASDPAVIGRPITINGRPFTIIGVAPQGFGGVLQGASTNALWIPTAMLRVGYRWCDAFAVPARCPVTEVLARLAPGSTVEGARAEVAAMSRALVSIDDPTDSLRSATVTPALGVRVTEQNGYLGLTRLLGAIAAILLVAACTNLAGLLLARGIVREREIALRASLGAGRPRIVRQLLGESALLAIVGGGLGVLLSAWGTQLLVGYFATDSEGYVHHFDVPLNARVVGLGVVVSLLTVFVFGLIPALYASRADAATMMKQGGGGGVSHERNRLRMTLVATQVALSVVLLVGAGLLVRSARGIASWQRFDAEHVALLRVRPRLVDYTPRQAQELLRRITAKLRALPDVEGVTLARGVGTVWESTDQISVARPGDAPRAERDRPRVPYHEISPDFFSTLRIPLREGRGFTEGDSAGMPKVAIVNETLAARLWPQGSPIDRVLQLGGVSARVVGVVHDYQMHTAREAAAAMALVPFWQNDFEPQVDARLAVRVRGDPAAALPILRRAIAELDPIVPVTEALPMTVQVSGKFGDVHLGAAVLVAAGALALFLSAIGLYGVMAFIVARRTREIGIRMAIGARADQVVRHFMRQALRAALVGSTIGLVVALAAGRLLAAWLVGVSPTDAVAFGTALAASGVVALLAAFFPARRASRVDPVIAMRAD